jgi:hypothetical protein
MARAVAMAMAMKTRLRDCEVEFLTILVRFPYSI